MRKRKKLKKIRWIEQEERWMQRYHELEAFRDEHGHTKVPVGYNPKTKFGRWAENQRTKYRKGELREDRIRLLNAINFPWGKGQVMSPEEKWMRRYKKLKSLHDEQGHLKIPTTDPLRQELNNWMKKQRAYYRKGTLSEDRFKLLDDVGFVWDGTQSQQKKWMKRFETLKSFHEEYGHTFIPKNYLPDPKLAIWQTSQRVKQRNGTLQKEREQLLNSIGFVWDGVSKLWRKQQWMERFNELKAFYEEHGHSRVPRENYTQLENWVRNQRTKREEGALKEDQIKLLEGVGFKWKKTKRLEERNNP